jgi:hypothetical protein
VPVAVGALSPSARQPGLNDGGLVISITVERVVPGEHPSLPGREIVVPGASCEVAVSRDWPSAVPERVVPFTTAIADSISLPSFAGGALGGILKSTFGARAMAAERLQGVRTYPRKEIWMRSRWN